MECTRKVKWDEFEGEGDILSYTLISLFFSDSRGILNANDSQLHLGLFKLA